MKILAFPLLILAGLLALGQPATAQPATGQLTAAVIEARQQYLSAFVSHPELYSGPEYSDYTQKYKERIGHQFFLSPERAVGSVTYNQRVFNQLMLNYDVVRDQVVVSPPQSPLTLHLISEKVTGFTIGSHRFTRLVADSAASTGIRTGFYEVLLDSTGGGAMRVLARRSKLLYERVSQSAINVVFSLNDKLFIEKSGRYQAVASKSAVLRLLADQSKPLQRYAQEHKLKFSKTQREASIVALATYYQQLRSGN